MLYSDDFIGPATAGAAGASPRPMIVAGFQLICCLHPPHFSFNYNTTVGVVVYLLLSQSFYLVIVLLSCPGRCFHFYSIISVVLDSGR